MGLRGTTPVCLQTEPCSPIGHTIRRGREDAQASPLAFSAYPSPWPAAGSPNAAALHKRPSWGEIPPKGNPALEHDWHLDVQMLVRTLKQKGWDSSKKTSVAERGKSPTPGTRKAKENGGDGELPSCQQRSCLFLSPSCKQAEVPSLLAVAQ